MEQFEMDSSKNCTIVDFGIVEPGKTYTKKIKMKSDQLALSPIKEILGEVNPLDQVFSVVRVEKAGKSSFNVLSTSYAPSLPHLNSFAYKRVHFDDGSSQFLHIKGATKGSNVKLSISKIFLFTNSAAPVSEYRLAMENTSDCYDFFQWDYISDSGIEIKPKSGVIPGNGRIDVFVHFRPKKIGLFYRSLPCLLKFQEPLFIEVFGFHSKTRMTLDLNKYVTLNETLPFYPTNYCRYVSDCANLLYPESKPIVSVSNRFIDYGSVSMFGSDDLATQQIFLTNHANKDLTVEWDSGIPDVFKAYPSKCSISQNGGVVRFSIVFRPNKPELFFCCELHASFLWGVNLEYTVPFSVTIHTIGDSFSSNGCSWSPLYVIDRTMICLPGTAPNLSTYTTFCISKSGSYPLQFTLEPVVRTGTPLFLVKPTQGLITDDFQLIIVQMIPPRKNDVVYKEDWYLNINNCRKVKLEICGNCELPFLLVGDGKQINFPPTTLGSISHFQVPLKNPTRLELQYHCLKSLQPDIFISSQENTKIGPGERQLVEFEFRPKKQGVIHSSVGIDVKWSPCHSAAVKSLRGASVQAETIVYLTGTAEVENISASPKHMSLADVLLNEWGIGSFFIHNSGHSIVFIRLECTTKFWFSTVGSWKMVPNDITLVPNCSIEIKLFLLGIERGFNVFNIQYQLYESPMFWKETGDPKELLDGDIFVTFPSLKIEDIRYHGLAKSLSKFFLWNVLQINKLNDILGRLETKREHYSNIKLPEYQENSSCLVVEFLLKNSSSVPVWVSVDLKKHCSCHPTRADTISRRLLDYSCPHEREMAASIQNNILAPGRSTILKLTTQYEVTDNCSFSMILNVATASDKKWMTSVRVEVERGIIATDKASLCFLLPKEFGCKIFYVSLEDIYLGDTSRYYQMIWLYNHSQLDCRYWAEWLAVNNKIFKLVNDKARVPAYSCRPLLIRFTPYELRTYKATLALVNESGEEFHIEIKGTGTVDKIVNTTPMRNKMPDVSQFENSGQDLELSLDHISVRALPTHSFDSYVFFMKNTSDKHVIHFNWERLIVWSTLKVVVVPKQGELLPGEIFPVQMNLHSFRFPAVLNFAVQCLYFRKNESDSYFRRSSCVSKFAMVYDSCFVLVPGKDNEPVYRNPKMSATAGKVPKNQITSIGGSIRIFNSEFIGDLISDIHNQMRFIPKPKLNIDRMSGRFSMVKLNQISQVTVILKNIIRDVVEDPMFMSNLQMKRPLLRYIDLPKKDSRRTTKIPGRQMGMLLVNLLYISTVRLFGVDPGVFHDVTLSVEGKRDVNKEPNLFNAYYQTILSTEVDQICIAPTKVRPRRLQSRDNLAFVQRPSA